ncbi:sensor histidine kinase KdpD [Massilia sp. LC238]|uniref:sensor histidine kinase n=1 Tax=Massilia sp. LC238 TaxID=1502852 RepID=UPI0004E47076|nr:HAMP domain-containing sensor histidine kinase [Massilia sp. LC238]KFC62333.1 Signal transduction histidine kinase [Massilia sp. LC238]
MAFSTDPQLGNDGLSTVSRKMLELRETVFEEWEARVRAELDKARPLPHPILIDTLPAFYDNIAQSLTPGYPRMIATEGTDIASQHGGERARLTEYAHENLIDEYQLLRWVIFDVLYRKGVQLSPSDVLTINSSLDIAIKEAVGGFAVVDRALRERFAAALTHDLRGPLGTTSSALELILSVEDFAKARVFAVKALENVHRMSGMIDELLHTMAFHSGEKISLRLLSFDIRKLIKEVQVELAFRDERIVLVDGAPIVGWWDWSVMKRALENILSNAIKYGKKPSPITVNAVETHGRLVLSVHNEGAPIPSEEQENIFQMFRRVKSQQIIQQQGWGIGLPYVRAAAESHAGSIVLDSTIERGTTFSIDIPVDCRPFCESKG